MARSHRSGQTGTMTRCGKCCYYCRQVTSFLFSHIGLCTLLLGYALVGAFTFQALESQHEHEQRLEMIRTRNEMILELSNMTNHSIILNRENWTQNAERILRKFELKFLHAVKRKGYDGNEELNKASLQWSFSGALLYSIIVITTIGYGNVAPRTDMGKIVTILYAIIGIPLMLFCLSNIGHAMAHSFKFIYWKCCCFLCVKPKKQQRRQRRRRRMIRQQRQRAMMVLSQQQQQMQTTVLENGANNVGVTANGGLNQLVPAGSRVLAQRPAHFRYPASNGQQSEQNSSSSFTTTPALTPLTGGSSNAQQVFFANPTPETSRDPSVNSILGKPKKSSLARSLSARYHNDHSSPVYGPQLSAPSTSNQTAPVASNNVANGKSRKDQMPAIICNRYASLSDECIDVYRGRNATDQPAQPATGRHSIATAPQQRIAPRRTPSQVRFMPQALPDLSVSSPSPDNQQPQSIPPPPPFPYPSGAETSTGNGSDQVPPPPFHAESSGYQEDMYDTIQNVPPYNYNDLNRFIVVNKEDFDFDLDSDSDDDDITEKNIPITVCLTLVVGYICGGAWFFSTSEEWSFLDASYFCFITLSTIGFGDLTPGRTVLATTPEEGQMTLAICALYLLFGMGLVAMSLSLIKEKVLETVRIIGERIGILVNEDEDYY